MKFISFVCFIALVAYLFMVLSESNMPNPWAPYPIGTCGFKVGSTYVATEESENPFETPSKPDTVTVKEIRKDFVQFTNGRTHRFGSFGINCYNWKKI